MLYIILIFILFGISLLSFLLIACFKQLAEINTLNKKIIQKHYPDISL